MEQQETQFLFVCFFSTLPGIFPAEKVQEVYGSEQIFFSERTRVVVRHGGSYYLVCQQLCELLPLTLLFGRQLIDKKEMFY